MDRVVPALWRRGSGSAGGSCSGGCSGVMGNPGPSHQAQRQATPRKQVQRTAREAWVQAAGGLTRLQSSAPSPAAQTPSAAAQTRLLEPSAGPPAAPSGFALPQACPQCAGRHPSWRQRGGEKREVEGGRQVGRGGGRGSGGSQAPTAGGHVVAAAATALRRAL